MLLRCPPACWASWQEKYESVQMYQMISAVSIPQETHFCTAQSGRRGGTNLWSNCLPACKCSPGKRKVRCDRLFQLSLLLKHSSADPRDRRNRGIALLAVQPVNDSLETENSLLISTESSSHVSSKAFFELPKQTKETVTGIILLDFQHDPSRSCLTLPLSQASSCSTSRTLSIP